MDGATPWRRAAPALASLMLWACIIVVGRFIAYNWFDCDIQPQPAFVNWFAAASCRRSIDAMLLPFFSGVNALARPFRRRIELAVSGDRVGAPAGAVGARRIGAVVDMRMLGLGLKRRACGDRARCAAVHDRRDRRDDRDRLPLFLSEPIKCYYSPAFWVKMTTLAIAILYTFTIRTRVTRAEPVRNTARLQMLVGALSIALWVTVAAAGRWIGFS
jgi:hypothetical protein